MTVLHTGLRHLNEKKKRTGKLFYERMVNLNTYRRPLKSKTKQHVIIQAKHYTFI